MIKKKIVVPEGMLVSALAHYQNVSRAAWSDDMYEVVRGTLEASLRWLSENPIFPTSRQIHDLAIDAFSIDAANNGDGWENTRAVCIEWQRSMFLAPETEIPDQIRDLIREQTLPYTIGVDVHNQAILEAFRRGQKAGTR